MVQHKHDKMNDIKNEFYKTFKDNEWFKGAGLYQSEKNKWCIMTLIRKENIEDIPDIWKGMEIRKTLVT